MTTMKRRGAKRRARSSSPKDSRLTPASALADLLARQATRDAVTFTVEEMTQMKRFPKGLRAKLAVKMELPELTPEPDQRGKHWARLRAAAEADGSFRVVFPDDSTKVVTLAEAAKLVGETPGALRAHIEQRRTYEYSDALGTTTVNRVGEKRGRY